jgi:hypothetical protein
MSRIKVLDNFHLDELVHPSILNQFGASSVRFLDRRALEGLQWLRNTLGHPLKVNDYFHGGAFQNSGLRPFNVKVGAQFSDHKFGRAWDVKCEHLTPDEIREHIIKHELFLTEANYITNIEEGTATWTHISNRLVNFPEEPNKILQIPFWRKAS